MQTKRAALCFGSAAWAEWICLNCQNVRNFNVTVTLNVTGFEKCGVYPRIGNSIQVAVLIWNSVKDRFPSSQFIQMCFHTIYSLKPGHPNMLSAPIWVDKRIFLCRLCTSKCCRHPMECHYIFLCGNAFSNYIWLCLERKV